MMPPSEGSVMFGDFNLATQRDKAFSQVGIAVCPQANTSLWDQLTVREHIRIFSMLRGNNDRNQEQQLLRDFLLEEHANKEVKKCSGGTKRKLCVCLAFVGDAKVMYVLLIYFTLEIAR